MEANKMRFNLVMNFLLITVLLFSIGTKASTVLATDEDQVSPQTTEASPAPVNQTVDALEKALSSIEQQQETIADLQERIGESDGLLKKALEARLDKAWLTLLQQRLNFAKSVAEQEDSGVDVAKYQEQVNDILGSQIDIAKTTAGRIKGLIEFPEPGFSAAEQAASYTKIFATMERLIRVYDLMLDSFEISQRFKIDLTKQDTLFKKDLAERAANVSIMLELAMNDVTVLRASVSAVPDDAELKAKLAVAENHVRNIANGMAAILTIMDSLKIDTAAYREQVLGATGEITKDVFEIGVLVRLLKGWWKAILNVIYEDGPALFFKMLLFFIIIFVFHKIAGIVQKIIEPGLEKSQLRLSELLRRMIVSIAGNIVIALGILIAFSQVGISLGPLLAGLGVVGFVVGFALQDSLANFASGLMILVYSPFDVGDLIDAGGVYGKVSQMSLVNTTIMTVDNQTIVVPNNKIWGDVIKNVTAQNIRRVDLVFGTSYSDDILKTERVLKKIVDEHDKVLSDPEPMIKLHELGDSSVNFVVRPWVNTADYWDVYWDITRTVKIRFDEEGISIPFPQRDVHLYNENAT
jgi:small conductance mechanosensitive channel